MKYYIENNLNSYINYDCIFVGLFDEKFLTLKDFIDDSILYKEKKKYFFNGEYNNFILIKDSYSEKKIDIIVIGFGNIVKLNEIKYINIINNCFNIIKKNKYIKILFSLHNIKINNRNLEWNINILIQTFEKLNYSFDLFKSKKKEKKDINIFFYVKKEQNDFFISNIKKYLIISKGIEKSKNLSNTPSNICTPLYISEKIRKIFIDKKIDLLFITEKIMKNKGMNAFLSVGKGSKNKSIMSIINYNNSLDNNSKPIVLIGKGLTFDSGGISIKPSMNMHEMKFDMAGASVIYGVMYILFKLNIKLHVIGVLACAENMLDKNSVKPGDVVKTLSGKTVEIINTDAEGRLVLCDVLTYISKYNPSIIIDVATLTGACVSALGKDISGLLSNNSNLSKYLLKSSINSMDYLWELPLYKKYKEHLKSNIADYANCGDKNYAGTITSALFLSFFIKKYKWAHIDIAGTAYDSNGATGRPINLLVDFIINYYKNKYDYK